MAEAPPPSAPSAPSTALIFRPPPNSAAPTPPDFSVPSPPFFHGTWHVTHSTLPMWKSNRNVRVSYKPCADNPEKLEDLVEYQALTGDKVKRIDGIDTPDPASPMCYHWRGKGMLRIASSHWLFLAAGEEEGGWGVTYFEKTMFSPAGIDVYARAKGGLSEGLVQRIKEGMASVEDGAFTKLAESLFVVNSD